MINIPLNHRAQKKFIKIDVTALARHIGLSRTYVSLVLHGHKKSKRARKLIAEALGIPYNELWGDK